MIGSGGGTRGAAAAPLSVSKATTFLATFEKAVNMVMKSFMKYDDEFFMTYL
jgi:hypothetical protein